MRGLWKLTWIEIKIFIREPLGALGTVLIPVIVFVAMGNLGTKLYQPNELNASRAFRVDVPVFAALLIAINACLSLVSIISIYREGGIL
ncbi:MAG: ABC transporter permease, partial [Thermoanaerobaculia bacterium]